jgi:hypothetical protein
MGEQRKSELVGRTSLLGDDLVQSIDQEMSERQRFTISELSCKFQQISSTLL